MNRVEKIRWLKNYQTQLVIFMEHETLALPTTVKFCMEVANIQEQIDILETLKLKSRYAVVGQVREKQTA